MTTPAPKNSQMMQGDEHKLFSRSMAWELSLMALCAYFEAQDQGEQGMLAVCWTMVNRVDTPGVTWWGDDEEDVILKKWQYTAMRVAKPLDEILPGDPTKNLVWGAALRMAERAYLRMGVDPTNGATHYYAPKIVAEPKWVKAPGTVFKCQIGDHLFYKAA